jgi:hypothetical protein
MMGIDLTLEYCGNLDEPEVNSRSQVMVTETFESLIVVSPVFSLTYVVWWLPIFLSSTNVPFLEPYFEGFSLYLRRFGYHVVLS